MTSSASRWALRCGCDAVSLPHQLYLGTAMKGGGASKSLPAGYLDRFEGLYQKVEQSWEGIFDLSLCNLSRRTRWWYPFTTIFSSFPDKVRKLKIFSVFFDFSDQKNRTRIIFLWILYTLDIQKWNLSSELAQEFPEFQNFQPPWVKNSEQFSVTTHSFYNISY